MKYLIVLFASLTMFSPLFLTGIRRYTGQKARRALGANIASFFACLILATVLGFGGSASAVGESAAAATGGLAEGLKYIGAGRWPVRHRRRHRRGRGRLFRAGRHLGE